MTDKLELVTKLLRDPGSLASNGARGADMPILGPIMPNHLNMPETLILGALLVASASGLLNSLPQTTPAFFTHELILFKYITMTWV